MKLFKYVIWLIIIGLLAMLVMQNIDYFKTAVILKLDSKVVETWKWEIPELLTGYYFIICFAVGLLLAGYKALCIKLRSSKQIKSMTTEIAQLKNEVNSLKEALEVYTHDPYIKKALTEDDVQSPPPQAQGLIDTDADAGKEE